MKTNSAASIASTRYIRVCSMRQNWGSLLCTSSGYRLYAGLLPGCGSGRPRLVMEFSDPKGIYQQIADQIRERVLQGEWQAGERIPSIRELAIDLGVNPNTVTKSYQAVNPISAASGW